MSLFRRAPRTRAADLLAHWFRPVVPEGHASLEAFEALLGDDERARLKKTLGKLASDGVERIHQVRGHDLDPDRAGLAYVDALLGPALLQNLTLRQEPSDPRNLFRVVGTELGCIVGEIHVRTGKGAWAPRRAPNLWRSRIVSPSGRDYDPFFAVVRQMSDERVDGGLVADYDASA